jgi:hypothetical protein
MLQQVALLANKAPGGVFSPGLDLINISLQADSQDVLRLLLPKDAMESAPPPPLPKPQQQQQLWFEACKACQHKDLGPVRRFFAAGGTPRHRVCHCVLPCPPSLRPSAQRIVRCSQSTVNGRLCRGETYGLALLCYTRACVTDACLRDRRLTLVCRGQPPLVGQ